jgi:hypothetical protein
MCDAPNSCRCDEGWMGPRCTEPSSMQRRMGDWVENHSHVVFKAISGSGLAVILAYALVVNVWARRPAASVGKLATSPSQSSPRKRVRFSAVLDTIPPSPVLSYHSSVNDDYSDRYRDDDLDARGLDDDDDPDAMSLPSDMDSDGGDWADGRGEDVHPDGHHHDHDDRDHDRVHDRDEPADTTRRDDMRGRSSHSPLPTTDAVSVPRRHSDA